MTTGSDLFRLLRALQPRQTTIQKWENATLAGLKAPNSSVHAYPGRDHAFARAGGKHYRETDAGIANARARLLREESRLALPGLRALPSR